jgi:hypothetical protein
MRLDLVHVILAGLIVGASSSTATQAAVGGFAYVSPLPGSRYVSPGNNVAIRPGAGLDPSSVVPGLVTVTGDKSGAHAGRLRLASDGLTIVFRPDQPYALDETVRVCIASGLRTRAGRALPGLEYTFHVSGADGRTFSRAAFEAELSAPPPRERAPWWREPAPAQAASATVCDTLLPGFPPISLVNADAALPGAFFISPFSTLDTTMARLEIIDDRGHALYERQFPHEYLPTDFKVQPDGRLTFWLTNANQFYAMDSAYAIVDSFVCGNGYPTDLHELKILPDGHVLMLSYDPQPVGMDTVVAGGDPNATVLGAIVQELDENRDVVFQWRSWDWFKITDASVAPDVNLLGARIDYVHTNSIEKCANGDYVISNRHMNEVTRIDGQTGALVWRMGLHAANNQFSFPNDTRGFSHQHDARVLPNGHLTLFDNGNFLSPQFSRALEFALDEPNRVATKVWDRHHEPEAYSAFMGNVERHADGSTTIGWGGMYNSLLKTTDLKTDGSVASELLYPLQQVTYRSFRRPWRTNRFLTSVTDLDVEAPAVGVSWGRTFQVWNHWDRPVTLTCLRTADGNFGATLASGSLPVTLAPGETTLVQAVYCPTDEQPATSRLYIIQSGTSELVAQTVTLHGHIGGTVGLQPGSGPALTATARPNPLCTRTTIEYSVPRAGPVTLELFDVRGRLVERLVDGVRPAGRHSVEWRVARGGSGLYFLRLRSSGLTLVRKLVAAGS